MLGRLSYKSRLFRHAILPFSLQTQFLLSLVASSSSLKLQVPANLKTSLVGPNDQVCSPSSSLRLQVPQDIGPASHHSPTIKFRLVAPLLFVFNSSSSPFKTSVRSIVHVYLPGPNIFAPLSLAVSKICTSPFEYIIVFSYPYNSHMRC